MKCVFCGGETKQMLVTFSYEEENRYFLVEHVLLRFVNDAERRHIPLMLPMSY